MSKPTDVNPIEWIRFFLAFQSPEKRYPLYQGATPSNIAAFMGISEFEFQEALKKFDEIAKNAAVSLLDEEEIRYQLKNLPFEQGQTILAFGDSLTDDKQGWFEILRHLVELYLPKPQLRWINAGISGDTSYDALRRLRKVVAHSPDWLIVAFGTNDAARPLLAPERTVISLADFWENINVISKVSEEYIPNLPIWITPPDVIPNMMEDIGYFDVVINNEDLEQFREVISGKPGYIVDPYGKRMGNPAEMWNYISDGLHHSPSGHMTTVRALLYTLSNEVEASPGKQLPQMS